MPDLSRELIVLADGVPLSFVRARLTGRDALGLYPMPFTLQVWNLAEEDYLALISARVLSVRHGDSMLASGSVSDTCRRTVAEGTITDVAFSAGLRLWDAPVSLSVEAGVSVSETVRRILSASGTGIRLLSFPGADLLRTRGQAFIGRAAECVEEALSAAGARGYLTDAGLCVVPAERLPVSMELSADDLLDEPVAVGDGLLLLRTRITGWPLGKQVSLKWEGGSAEGLIAEQSMDADTAEGNWQCELLLELTV